MGLSGQHALTFGCVNRVKFRDAKTSYSWYTWGKVHIIAPSCQPKLCSKMPKSKSAGKIQMNEYKYPCYYIPTISTVCHTVTSHYITKILMTHHVCMLLFCLFKLRILILPQHHLVASKHMHHTYTIWMLLTQSNLPWACSSLNTVTISSIITLHSLQCHSNDLPGTRNIATWRLPINWNLWGENYIAISNKNIV